MTHTNLKAEMIDRGEDISPDPQELGIIFRVQEVSRQGRQCWTVIARKNGEAIGGDHSWLNKEMANYARVLYYLRPSLHGKPVMEVMGEASKIFGHGRIEKVTVQ